MSWYPCPECGLEYVGDGCDHHSSDGKCYVCGSTPVAPSELAVRPPNDNMYSGVLAVPSDDERGEAPTA